MIFLKHTMLFAKTCTVSVNLDIYLIEKHKIIEFQVQMRSQYHHENKKKDRFLSSRLEMVPNAHFTHNYCLKEEIFTVETF